MRYEERRAHPTYFFKNQIVVLYMKIIEQLKQRAKRLKTDLYALYLAYGDPRVPWYAKIIVACVVAYAFSPIDLIPDFIPILGYLDDLILVPLGITLVIKLIPKEVMEEYRVKAQLNTQRNKPKNSIAAAVIIFIWVLLAVFSVRFVLRLIYK